MARKIEYTKGQKVGECWFVEEVPAYIEPNGKPTRKALFKCKCGKEFECKIRHVKDGTTKSCGCYYIEFQKQRSKDSKHLRKHPLYDAWSNIVQRCTNPKNESYPYYGAKGITICNEWRNSSETFINWCLDNGWKKGLEVDRVDGLKGYSPNNCRITTKTVNNRNRVISPKNKTGYIGVSAYRSRFCAKISLNNKSKHIGVYSTPKEAAIARDQYIIDNNLEGYNLQVLK